MNAITESNITSQIPTTPGTPFEGGFYVGTISTGADIYALIVAPKAAGRHAPAVWNASYDQVAGADSFFDGFANTKTMAAAGSAIAKWALALNIDGFNDWYLASRDELELLYRHFKPTADANYVYRNGENPSSVPVGYPYTATSPAQTAVVAFQDGGAEAFEDEWFWSSSQYSADGAWGQGFYGGSQYRAGKDGGGRAVAVRRLKI